MHLAKDWFGKEVLKASSSHESNALFEKCPTLLTKYDPKAFECSTTDETSTEENKVDDELADRMKKIGIRQ